MISATPGLLAASVQAGTVAPLPAEAPIGGPLWSYVIPALLLAIATFGTFLLYRHFATRED
ncbi:MAG: hypothetical protein JSW46_05070 [Gemmatimonadota bacterium]|nr:MAG: hypothetical protein JSW46_05070 [Gemmatimonadota bacterium]